MIPLQDILEQTCVSRRKRQHHRAVAAVLAVVFPGVQDKGFKGLRLELRVLPPHLQPISRVRSYPSRPAYSDVHALVTLFDIKRWPADVRSLTCSGSAVSAARAAGLRGHSWLARREAKDSMLRCVRPCTTSTASKISTSPDFIWTTRQVPQACLRQSSLGQEMAN